MVSNNESINVKKRNGRGLEKLDIEKIHAMVEYACEDITGVSSSQVEMNSGLQFYDGISTEEIQQIMIINDVELFLKVQYLKQPKENVELCQDLDSMVLLTQF